MQPEVGNKSSIGFIIAALILISLFVYFPTLHQAEAAYSSYWWGGAESSDPSALPNQGVQSVIEIQPQTGIAGRISPWVSDDLSNNIWIQAGYYVTGTGAPTGFYQIWNLTSNIVIKSGYYQVATGSHKFSIYLASGTIWGIFYDNIQVGTYDAKTNISSSTYPVEAQVELANSVASTFPFNTVDFPIALSVIKSAGSNWTPVEKAVSYGSTFGTAGQLQNSSLVSNQINVGSKIPVIASGNLLWNANSSGLVDSIPPIVSFSTPMNGSWSNAQATIALNATDNIGIANVKLYLDNSLLSIDNNSPYAFNLDTTKYSNSQHILRAIATDINNNSASSSIMINIDNIPPTISVPTSFAVPATSTIGAIVSYTVNATDDGKLSNLTCTPASGSTFPIGTTTVVCTALDQAGNSAVAAFTITVLSVAQTAPVQPPNLQLPPAITVQASSSAGAPVTYSVGATDSTGHSIPVQCNPASGSTFAITTTTVTCQATDAYGNKATGTFTVSVIDTISPSLSIAGPAAGSQVSGTVMINVQAADNTGVAKVAIYIDGKLKTTDTLAPYTYSWSTKALKQGSHTITAIATDLYGNQATTSIQVTR